jgi:GTP-binding protein EngB required for normal cell division
MPGCLSSPAKPVKMFIDRIFVSSRMSSLVFPRLQRERRRRADAEQEAEKWRQRAEQLQVQDEAQARTVLDDARVDFGRAEDERKQAVADREAAEEERKHAADTMKKAEELLARVRRAGQWAVDRAAKLNSIEEALVVREKAVREEEESHELKRLGIYPTNDVTESDIQMARYEVGYVPNSVNVCVIGAPRSGKSSLINALRGVDAADVYAAPVLGPRSTDYGRPTVYYDARTPGLVYHEVPEGRTTDLSGWDYYISRRLFAYDVIVFVHSDSPGELETRIAQVAHRRGQPCLNVRSKADEHIRNTRRISKYTLVDDARGAYMSRVHEEANQRCEASSKLEALRAPRDCEFVVSEMGLYRLVTGEDDPEEVYGTGEEDEARLLQVMRDLVHPRFDVKEEELEDVLKGDEAPDAEEQTHHVAGEPTVEEVIAQVEAALRIDGHDDHNGHNDGHINELEGHEHHDEQPKVETSAKELETPYATPFEFAPSVDISTANGHLTPDANGVKDHQVSVDDVSDYGAQDEITQVDDSKLTKEADIRYDEPIGTCGERI